MKCWAMNKTDSYLINMSRLLFFNQNIQHCPLYYRRLSHPLLILSRDWETDDSKDCASRPFSPASNIYGILCTVYASTTLIIFSWVWNLTVSCITPGTLQSSCSVHCPRPKTLYPIFEEVIILTLGTYEVSFNLWARSCIWFHSSRRCSLGI